MTSSSKRRASSSKQSSAGKAHVISVGRKDALPRQGNVSAGRRKPAVPPPVDAPKEPLATALARSKKKAHTPQQAATSASRTKTATAAGRAPRKLPAAALEAAQGEALVIGETEVEVEASAIIEETTIVEAPPAPAPHHGRRALVTAASRLFSMLSRWTGVRQ